MTYILLDLNDKISLYLNRIVNNLDFTNDQGRIQDFPEGGANPEVGSANIFILFGQIFLKTACKCRKLDRGGTHPKIYNVDPPLMIVRKPPLGRD